MLELQELTQSYQGQVVLDHCSLTFEPRTLHCLIGPNGAGKSTLLEIAGRLRVPDHGRVLIHGRPLGVWKHLELARELCILTQFQEHLPVMTVEAYVACGRFPWNPGNPTARDMEVVMEALELTGLVDARHKLLPLLSGGQRQRAHVALALAQESPCILLDEPLNHLDLTHGLAIMSLLKKLATQGKTVITVLHDINMAAMFGDQIHCLHQGRLAYSGPSTGFFGSGALKTCFGLEEVLIHHKGKELCIPY